MIVLLFLLMKCVIIPYTPQQEAGYVEGFLALSEGITLLKLRADFSGERRVPSGKKYFGNAILFG